MGNYRTGPRILLKKGKSKHDKSKKNRREFIKRKDKTSRKSRELDSKSCKDKIGLKVPWNNNKGKERIWIINQA